MPPLRKAKPRQRKALTAIPYQALSCFSLETLQNEQIRSRARFDARRRQEVAIVRKRGACMRCKLLKIRVSFIITFYIDLTTEESSVMERILVKLV